MRAQFQGERSHLWKGGKIQRKGYVFVLAPDHPSCQGNTKRYVPEHRVVMEQMLGRLLERHEQVHHKNGVRSDNRPENLELWAKQQPPGQRVHEQQHCPTCDCEDASVRWILIWQGSDDGIDWIDVADAVDAGYKHRRQVWVKA